MLTVTTQITANMTMYQLMRILSSRFDHQVVLPDGRRGYLRSIEREDGSGRSSTYTSTSAVVASSPSMFGPSTRHRYLYTQPSPWGVAM